MKIIWFLRAAVLGLILFISTRPSVVRPDAGHSSRWAVLIDKSISMSVTDPIARFEKAQILAASIINRFPDFQLYSFGKNVSKIELDDLKLLQPDDKSSDMTKALRTVFQKEPYRGVLILTDGRHIGEGDPLSTAALAGKPVITVGFGNKDLYKDISVKQIQSPPFAFKNVPTSLTAVISVIGFSGEKIAIKLKDGRKVVSIQYLQVTGNDVESTITFNWTPEELGTKNLKVEVSEFKGEFTYQNNFKQITLDVGRDRFRVLYLCGKPGPEYGFLRHQFKSDPAVELVTFVILRNASNVLNVPDSELSLIPFPTQSVLVDQMASFDLIVFEEFAYEKYGLLPNVLFSIRKKVENGGSFLLIGGEEVLGPKSQYNIPGIKEMIPVVIGDPSVKTVKQSLRIKPNTYQHPILKLDANEAANIKIWNELPPVEEVTLVPQVKEGATVLASVDYEGKKYPLLTVWKQGKGRSAVLTTRTTWRFSMVETKNNKNVEAYQQFWKNMVLWLTHSDEYKSVRVALDSKRLNVGQTEPLKVWVYDEYFKPISDVDVKVQLSKPDGSTDHLQTYQETKGVFSANFNGEAIGDYSARAWVFRGGKKFGEDKINFQVVNSHDEEKDLRPDYPFLRELALVSGGQFVTSDEFSLEAFDEFNADISNKIGKKVLIWNSPYIFILIISLLIAEWVIRKRRGLP